MTSTVLPDSIRLHSTSAYVGPLGTGAAGAAGSKRNNIIADPAIDQAGGRIAANVVDPAVAALVERSVKASIYGVKSGTQSPLGALRQVAEALAARLSPEQVRAPAHLK